MKGVTLPLIAVVVMELTKVILNCLELIIRQLSMAASSTTQLGVEAVLNSES